MLIEQVVVLFETHQICLYRIFGWATSSRRYFFCVSLCVDLRDLRCVLDKVNLRCRPYYHENTGSHSNSEVKRGKARLVLGSGTAWEPLWVLTAFYRHDSPF